MFINFLATRCVSALETKDVRFFRVQWAKCNVMKALETMLIVKIICKHINFHSISHLGGCGRKMRDHCSQGQCRVALYSGISQSDCIHSVNNCLAGWASLIRNWPWRRPPHSYLKPHILSSHHHSPWGPCSCSPLSSPSPRLAQTRAHYII